VSLTTGRGPLSPKRAGRFTAPVPDGVSYIEPFDRRVRAVVGGTTVIDSEQALLVHRPGRPPTLAFPVADVTGVATEAAPEVPDHVTVPWDGPDAWYEEEEQFFGHPRNPYHRIDCLRTTRRLRVAVGDVVLVDATDTLALYETALAPKLYVHRDVLRVELAPSEKTTYCPYKGTASYWSAVIDDGTVADVAWSYEDPLPESEPIRGLLSFDPERASVTADLPRQ